MSDNDELTIAYMLGAADTHDSYRLERTKLPTVRGWYWYMPAHRVAGVREKYEELFLTTSAPVPIAAYFEPENEPEPFNIDGIWYKLNQLPGWFHGPSKEAAQLSKEAQV